MPDIIAQIRDRPSTQDGLHGKVERDMEDLVATARAQPLDEGNIVFDMLDHVGNDDDVESTILLLKYIAQLKGNATGFLRLCSLIGVGGNLIAGKMCLWKGARQIQEDFTCTAADFAKAVEVQPIFANNRFDLMCLPRGILLVPRRVQFGILVGEIDIVQS